MNKKNNKEWMEIPKYITIMTVFAICIFGSMILISALEISFLVKLFFGVAALLMWVWIWCYYEHKQSQKRAEQCKEDN